MNRADLVAALVLLPMPLVAMATAMVVASGRGLLAGLLIVPAATVTVLLVLFLERRRRRDRRARAAQGWREGTARQDDVDTEEMRLPVTS